MLGFTVGKHALELLGLDVAEALFDLLGLKKLGVGRDAEFLETLVFKVKGGAVVELGHAFVAIKSFDGDVWCAEALGHGALETKVLAIQRRRCSVNNLALRDDLGVAAGAHLGQGREPRVPQNTREAFIHRVKS